MGLFWKPQHPVIGLFAHHHPFLPFKYKRGLRANNKQTRKRHQPTLASNYTIGLHEVRLTSRRYRDTGHKMTVTDDECLWNNVGSHKHHSETDLRRLPSDKSTALPPGLQQARATQASWIKCKMQACKSSQMD